MEVELSINTLKNILTALTATHSEVNIVMSNDPVKLQFISSNTDCILYWGTSEIVVKKSTEAFFKSETVQIEKLLSRLITNTSRVSLTMSNDPDDQTLYFKQYLSINNVATGKSLVMTDIYNLFCLRIPYIEKHDECNDFIVDYVQFNYEFNKPSYPMAVFDIRILERMINTSLIYTTEIEMIIDADRMSFRTNQGDNLSVSSKLINSDKRPVTKRISIGQLSYIKAYRKTSQLISVSFLSSNDKQCLLIKPITANNSMDTCLIIFFN